MASTRVTKVYTNTGDRRTYTVSAWVKRSKLGATQDVISAYRSTDGLQTDVMRFPSDDTFQFYMHSTNSAGNCEIKTIRKFRDPNAWYHFVTRVDTTQGTAADRVRIYVNGVQETAFATENYMNQNGEGVWGIGASHTTHTIGAVGTANYFDGYVSHVHYADGQSLAPTVFGETDSTTGEWKIKTDPSFTLGTNGFTILKDGNTVTDQSTNSNDFSVAAGTLTKSEDNPSHIFATFNPIYNSGGTVTYSAGNTRFTEADNQWKTTFSTLGASSGKYYAEFKCNGAWMMVGVADYNVTKSGTADRNFGSSTDITTQGYGYYNANGDLYYRGSSTSYGDTYNNGDIVQVALDCDNNRIFFGKNGTWQNSADPTSAGTGFSMNATDATYVFAASVQQDEIHANFGNGYFNTTAISSAGTNASGIGIFEYDVPTGYTALSTKGLNE